MKQRIKPPVGLAANYLKWEKLNNEMGQTVLQIMSHPDSTLEQLWGVRLTYAERCESFKDMRRQLRDLFKDGHYSFEKYPWNK